MTQTWSYTFLFPYEQFAPPAVHVYYKWYRLARGMVIITHPSDDIYIYRISGYLRGKIIYLQETSCA
ncbi:hypothetical protein GHT06_011886 [Daphnia sinensis]|uniref:Uncharacterized protein n=1 Tax=Daphnia sinensis TaxID=1820382 RepID=A0AAD5LFC4_9CRUS|nr:hypothetical protein GHT06_011886 [Daphnia sinensis]